MQKENILKDKYFKTFLIFSKEDKKEKKIGLILVLMRTNITEFQALDNDWYDPISLLICDILVHIVSLTDGKPISQGVRDTNKSMFFWRT